MRKRYWWGTAMGLAVLGLAWAGSQAYRHPNSFLGRCLVSAATVPALLVTADNPMSAAPAGTTANGTAEELIPADPTPIKEPATEPPVQSLEMSGVMELSPSTGNETPAPIVIPEEAPPEPALTVVQKSSPVMPSIEQASVIPTSTCPRTMPYCGDDSEMRPTMPHVVDDMPYVPDEEPRTSGQGQIENTFRLWASVLMQGADKSSRPSKQVAQVAGPNGPPCQEDGHLHEQYPGCPFTGSCPVPGQEIAKPVIVPAQLRKPGQEECEESLPDVPRRNDLHSTHKMPIQAEEYPRHPEVDTMDFRPGEDGTLNEFGLGPF